MHKQVVHAVKHGWLLNRIEPPVGVVPKRTVFAMVVLFTADPVSNVS